MISLAKDLAANPWLNGQVIVRPHPTLEPEVAVVVRSNGHVPALGPFSVQVAPMTTSFSAGSYTVPAMNFWEVQIIDPRLAAVSGFRTRPWRSGP